MQNENEKDVSKLTPFLEILKIHIGLGKYHSESE